MVRRVTSSNYIGRVHERAQLDAALDAAVHGEPALVLIGGEAGIGKTRLVTEVEAMARRRDGMMLRGHSVQTTIGSTAFAPFVEILHRLHADAPEDLASIDDRARAELARLVPRLEPTRSTGRTSTDESPLPLFHAVDEILRYVAGRRPLVLVVEDIHWADASTLDLLRFLATRLGLQRLLAVATFRSDEIHQNDALPRFLAEAERLPVVQRIELLHLTRRGRRSDRRDRRRTSGPGSRRSHLRSIGWQPVLRRGALDGRDAGGFPAEVARRRPCRPDRGSLVRRTGHHPGRRNHRS
jgi:predicted ATPase